MPRLKPQNPNVALDVEITKVLAIVNVQIHILEIANLGPQRRQISKAFKFEEKPKDPSVILQNMYIDKKNGGNEPFLLSSVINNLILHN